ncbi:hypothetical protein AYO20_10817 [Fonsecaea nubica]|uniref:Uncharacterized protein n=1 Tax=Fonsecaea nubica TaxID=856822 RepID=A0A178C304_9EURO|nr:hypothetical protein AYO20_10817 [Fonsecaea nubica]OAL23967.1 hypothetical protein AYO20_10817 [Fonsecaea nubica]
MSSLILLLIVLSIFFCCRFYLQHPQRRVPISVTGAKQRPPVARNLTALDFGKIKPYQGDPTQDVPAYSRSWKGSRYLMTMGIRKLDVNDWLIIDDLYPSAHRDKVARLQTPEREVVFQYLDGTYEACLEGLEIIVRYLTTRYPHVFVLEGDYVVNNIVGERYRIQEPMDKHPLEVASLLVYEDVHILQEGSDQLYSLRASAMSFPPGWTAEERIGMPIRELHAPIPTWKEKLQVSMERSVKIACMYFVNMKVGGGVQRNNLFMQPTHENYHPGRLDAYPPCHSIKQVHLRMELQSLMRMPKTRALLFTVHPWIIPVTDLANEPDKLEILWSQIRTYPDNFAEYKLRHLWGDVFEEFAKTVLNKASPQPRDEEGGGNSSARAPSKPATGF